jgi:hypothetical protein
MQSSLKKYREKIALSVINVCMIIMLIFAVLSIFCLTIGRYDVVIVVPFWGLICFPMIKDYRSRCGYYPWSKKAPIISLREQLRIFFGIALEGD